MCGSRERRVSFAVRREICTRLRCRRGFIVAGGSLQQGVLGYFLGDHRFEFEIRQLEQTDRLLQLWRQDERLSLSEIEAWAERHGAKRLAAKD